MRKITDKLRRINPFARKNDGPLPRPLPGDPSLRVVKVFVEGYEDVAFWRGVFDCFSNPYLYFEISVPTRKDLPKGKKVLMSMIPESSERMLLCVDSDFDFLFHTDATEQSRLIRDSCGRMFHTYAYATENYLCYAPSLHNVCVQARRRTIRASSTSSGSWPTTRASIYPSLSVVRLLGAAGVGTSMRSRWPISSASGAAQLPRIRAQRDCGRWRGCSRNVARREQALRQQRHAETGRAGAGRFRRTTRSGAGVTPENDLSLSCTGTRSMDNVVMVLLEHRLREAASDDCRSPRSRPLRKRRAWR